MATRANTDWRQALDDVAHGHSAAIVQTLPPCSLDCRRCRRKRTCEVAATIAALAGPSTRTHGRRRR